MNEEKIKEILEENAKLKEELEATKEHLKKYTAPASNKVYYEKHKCKIITKRLLFCFCGFLGRCCLGAPILTGIDHLF